METDDFLSQILFEDEEEVKTPDVVRVGTSQEISVKDLGEGEEEKEEEEEEEGGEDEGEGEESWDGIRLSIAGKIPVSKNAFKIQEPYEAGAQRFTLKYNLGTATTPKGLKCLPVIVDGNADSFRMGDRCGVHSLRVNGNSVPTEAWTVCRWRSEFLFEDDSKWMMRDEKQRSELLEKFRVDVGGQKRLVLKTEVLGEGRGIRVVSYEEGKGTVETVLFGSGNVTLEGTNHVFRHGLERASKNAFSLVLLDDVISNVTSFSYELDTTALAMTLEMEDRLEVKRSKANFAVLLHALKSSVLAPTCLRNLLGFRKTQINVIGTTAYSADLQQARFKTRRSDMYAEMERGAGPAAASSSSGYGDAGVRGASVVSRKRPGAEFSGSSGWALQHEVSTIHASITPKILLVPKRRLMAVFVVMNDKELPSSPEMILVSILAHPPEESKNAMSLRSRVNMLPSNIRFHRMMEGRETVEADVDTDVVHIEEGETMARIAAHVDDSTLRGTSIPSLLLRSSTTRDDKRVMQIEVSPGEDASAYILFCSSHFTSLPASLNKGVSLFDARAREQMFLGASGSGIDRRTIQSGVFVPGTKSSSTIIDVTATVLAQK